MSRYLGSLGIALGSLIATDCEVTRHTYRFAASTGVRDLAMLSRVMVCVAICALLLCGSALRAQNAEPPATAIERLDRLQAALREARGRSDWAAYLVAARQMKELLNDSPRSRLESARAESHAGHAAAVLDDLSAYAHMGQSSDGVERLPDFAALRHRKDFDAVRASLAANRRAVSLSTVAFHIPDPGLLPEDIDFDPHSRRFFLSSVLQHRIVSIANDGSLAEFTNAPDDWPLFALKIDAKQQVLWATEVAVDGFDAVTKSDGGRSAVLCYDLNTGKLIRRIEGPRPSALGDMVLTEEGSVIVSDGEHGGLYRLKPGEDQLERLDHGDFISPQTVAMASDADHAYVPDYVRGLGVFDLESKQVRWFPMGGRFALAGIDGLYRVGEQLIAVQNGTTPERVVLFSVDTAARKIVAEQVIERATTTLGDPTHGVMVDGAFYYIANSGWDALGANGLVESGATMTESAVMKWSLPGTDEFEIPPDEEPAASLPAGQVSGEDFHIGTPVHSDGLMHHYVVESRFGTFFAYGKRALISRLREVAALTNIAKTSDAAVVLKSAGRSLQEDASAVADLAKHPVGVMTGIPKGVSHLFGGYRAKAKEVSAEISKDAQQSHDSHDSKQTTRGVIDKTSTQAKQYASRYLGVTAAQMRWYQKLGADPYTSNEVLRKSVNHVAQIDAATGLGMHFAPVPGIPFAGDVRRALNTIYNEDPAALRLKRRAALAGYGLAPDEIERFENTVLLSPTRQAVLVEAAKALDGVADRAELFRHAMSVTSEEEVEVFLSSLHLLLDFHARQPVARIESGLRLPTAQLADGRVLVFGAFDAVYWTKEVAGYERSLAEAIPADVPARELRLSGFLSSRARSELEKRGWQVHDRLGEQGAEGDR